MYECVVSHVWMSHVTCMNDSSHKYEWVMSHVWMSHVTHMIVSCHMHECVVYHVNVPWHTHEWVMPHRWMGHATRMNASCHTQWVMLRTEWMSHVTREISHDMYECVTPHINEPYWIQLTLPHTLQRTQHVINRLNKTHTSAHTATNITHTSTHTATNVSHTATHTARNITHIATHTALNRTCRKHSVALLPAPWAGISQLTQMASFCSEITWPGNLGTERSPFGWVG